MQQMMTVRDPQTVPRRKSRRLAIIALSPANHPCRRSKRPPELSVSRGTWTKLIELDWIRRFGRRKMNARPAGDLWLYPRVSGAFRLKSPRDLPGLQELRLPGLSRGARIQCNSRLSQPTKNQEATERPERAVRGLIPRGLKIAGKDVILSPDIDLCGSESRMNQIVNHDHAGGGGGRGGG